MTADPGCSSRNPLHDLLDRMIVQVQAFHDLLKEEQQAIRSLSFGQFADVTEKKTRLLNALRDLEQDRRRLTDESSTAVDRSDSQLEDKQAALLAVISATDQMNRLNASLIGQSLAFLQGSLSLWQRSPASASLYSSRGSVVPAVPQGIGVKG